MYAFWESYKTPTVRVFWYLGQGLKSIHIDRFSTYYWYKIFKLNTSWKAAISSSSFTLFWDLVHDWGFMNWTSKNFLLRDDLVYPNIGKNLIYYYVIFQDSVLRFSWVFPIFIESVRNISPNEAYAISTIILFLGKVFIDC